jgi:hypothetical protein
MSKPITDNQKADFLAFCKQQTDERFCLCHFEAFEETDEDEEPLWELGDWGDDTYDVYELFASVQPEFSIEQQGHDTFYVCKPGEEDDEDEEDEEPPQETPKETVGYVSLTQHDFDLGHEKDETVAFIDKDLDNAALCQKVRETLAEANELEPDELDMSKDGVVERDGNTTTILWTDSRGQRSRTTLEFRSFVRWTDSNGNKCSSEVIE